MKLPVVDGTDNADEYGFANSEHEAETIARASFMDELASVEIDGPVRMRDGRVLPVAYVALTVDFEPILDFARRHY